MSDFEDLDGSIDYDFNEVLSEGDEPVDEPEDGMEGEADLIGEEADAVDDGEDEEEGDEEDGEDDYDEEAEVELGSQDTDDDEEDEEEEVRKIVRSWLPSLKRHRGLTFCLFDCTQGDDEDNDVSRTHIIGSVWVLWACLSYPTVTYTLFVQEDDGDEGDEDENDDGDGEDEGGNDDGDENDEDENDGGDEDNDVDDDEDEDDVDDEDDDENDESEDEEEEELGTKALLGPEIRDDVDAAVGKNRKSYAFQCSIWKYSDQCHSFA